MLVRDPQTQKNETHLTFEHFDLHVHEIIQN